MDIMWFMRRVCMVDTAILSLRVRGVLEHDANDWNAERRPTCVWYLKTMRYIEHIFEMLMVHQYSRNHDRCLSPPPSPSCASAEFAKSDCSVYDLQIFIQQNTLINFLVTLKIGHTIITSLNAYVDHKTPFVDASCYKGKSMINMKPSNCHI